MNKDFRIYPALLSFDIPGDIGIVFPDFPGCTGQCKADADVMAYAQETLAFHLSGMIDDNEEIPVPSLVSDIRAKKYEAVMPVRIYMPQFLENLYNKAENRTVTLPYWLNKAAKEAHINFSQTLQDALMEKLGIKREIKRRHYKKSAQN